VWLDIILIILIEETETTLDALPSEAAFKTQVHIENKIFKFIYFV
jgi:hypothetical protein